MIGYTYQVLTERLGGGVPSQAVYHVLGDSQTEAGKRLSEHLGLTPDEKMNCVRHLSANEVEALELTKHQVILAA